MELSVVIIATDEELRAILQIQVDGTSVAKTAQSFGSYPVAVTDSLVRRIQDINPQVVIVDVARQSSGEAVRAIEVLRTAVPQAAIFAIGETSQPQVIISVMRAGAREFLEKPTTVNVLLEAFVRVTSSQRKSYQPGRRGKVFTFLNARGGAGATTLAVNTAVSLQKMASSVVLVDLAPLAHASLHLNVRPTFTLSDVLRNLQRLDHALLESYLTAATGGLQLLAGATEPDANELLSTDFARLFDVLVGRFEYVIVDASSRLDRFAKLICELSDNVLLVAQPDVSSLWSASKLQDYIGDREQGKHVQLVVNRFRKIPGLSESDIERATRMPISYRIPNQYNIVASSIDRGLPLVEENHTEIARAVVNMASTLAGKPAEQKKKSFSFFGS